MSGWCPKSCVIAWMKSVDADGFLGVLRGSVQQAAGLARMKKIGIPILYAVGRRCHGRLRLCSEA